MNAPYFALRSAVVAALVLGSGGVAVAQATRTYVSGVGDDVNPCSRTAPCKTLAGALAKTAASGEINVLDAGDFGGGATLSITKSVTISGEGTEASVSVGGVDGITVDAGASDVVVLRSLSIAETSSAATSGSGIRFIAGKALYVEDCDISGFPEHGVAFAPALGGELVVTGTRASGNGGAGVLVQSASLAPAAVAILSRSHLAGNAHGLLAADGASVTAYDSTTAHNTDTGVAVLPLGVGTAEVNLEGVTLAGDATCLRAAAPVGAAVMRLSKVMALSCVTATTTADAHSTVRSFGNNRLLGAGGAQLCDSGVVCAPAACFAPGFCSPETGSCVYVPEADGTACDDGDACTSGDVCQAGVCLGGSSPPCAGADQCHVSGACDPLTGACTQLAKADGAACDDGDACTASDVCRSGVCTGESPVVCVALDDAHVAGVCAPTSGLCSNPEKAAVPPTGTEPVVSSPGKGCGCQASGAGEIGRAHV